MQYISDRTYGCRVMEVFLSGNRSLIIENEKIRLIVILDKGCDIAEFTYKTNDTSFLWRTDKGLKSLDNVHKHYNHYFTQAYHGGWFEAFPNVGLSCKYKGADFEPYDEVFYLPWDYTVIKDEPEELVLSFNVKTLKTPFLLEKKLTLQAHSSAVRFDEKITNIGNESVGYQWGHHPLLGQPFLSGDCIIDFEGADIDCLFEPDNARVRQGTKGQWPVLSGKNGNVDIRQVPPPNTVTNELYWMSNLQTNWLAVRNPAINTGIGFAWDPEMFKYCLLWVNANGDSGSPHYGNCYTTCIMPSTSGVHTLEAEEKKGTLNTLNPSETAETWITATVFKAGNEEVKEIGRDGRVIID